MRVREFHMREYYDEEIDDYNTAFSFVVDYEGMPVFSVRNDYICN